MAQVERYLFSCEITKLCMLLFDQIIVVVEVVALFALLSILRVRKYIGKRMYNTVKLCGSRGGAVRSASGGKASQVGGLAIN